MCVGNHDVCKWASLHSGSGTLQVSSAPQGGGSPQHVSDPVFAAAQRQGLLLSWHFPRSVTARQRHLFCPTTPRSGRDCLGWMQSRAPWAPVSQVATENFILITPSQFTTPKSRLYRSSQGVHTRVCKTSTWMPCPGGTWFS